jgi:ferritin-like protein
VIGKETWINPARREDRKAVLWTLISDPGTAAREFKHLTNLTSLLDGGVILRDEIHEVVQSLPADHPRRVEGLAEVAGIMAWREQKIEEAMEIYVQAEESALADGNEAILSLTRAYPARCLAQGASDWVKTWELASKVVGAELPERNRKWFRKESPKWKRAIGE